MGKGIVKDWDNIHSCLGSYLDIWEADDLPVALCAGLRYQPSLVFLEGPLLAPREQELAESTCQSLSHLSAPGTGQ